MDQTTFVLSVLIGSLIGHIAGRFIPPSRHDARAAALIVAICGSVVGGWLLMQTGAPTTIALLGALGIATVPARAVATSRRRPPDRRLRRSPHAAGWSRSGRG